MSYREYKQQNFLGVDTLSSPLEISKRRASYMENLISRNGVNHKRYGWEEQTNLDLQQDEFILGSFNLGNGVFFIGTNKRVRRYNVFSNEKDILIQPHVNERFTAFNAVAHNGKVFIFVGNNIYVYDIKAKEIEDYNGFYVPTTRVQLDIGVFDLYQSPNKLISKRINKFSGKLYENYNGLIELELDDFLDASKEAILKLSKVDTGLVLKEIPKESIPPKETPLSLVSSLGLEKDKYYFTITYEKKGWVWSDENAYNDAIDKIDVNYSRDNFLWYLNQTEENKPIGTVAKRIADEEYEFYEVSSGEYNQSDTRLDVRAPEYPSGWFGGLDVMYLFKRDHYQYYDSVNSRNYHDFAVRVIDNYGYSYWKLRKNDTDDYAILVDGADGINVAKETKYFQCKEERTIIDEEYILDLESHEFVNEAGDILGKLVNKNGKSYIEILDIEDSETETIEIPARERIYNDISYNIEVEYSVIDYDGISNLIKEATIVEVINVGEGEILVLSGFSGEHKNHIMFSDAENFYYFPDDDGHHFRLGMTPIANIIRLADGTIAIVKEDSLNEPTVYFGTAKTSQVEIMGFDVIKDIRFYFMSGAIGVGGINQKTVANLLGDNLFLTRQGIMALALVENIKINERYARERSRFINTELLKHDLSQAVATSYQGFYILAVNDLEGTTYVLDSRYKVRADGDLTDTFNYESFIWKNVSAVSFETYRNELYFIRPDGRVCKFVKDNYYDITYRSLPAYSTLFRYEDNEFYGVVSQEYARLSTGDILVIKQRDNEPINLNMTYTNDLGNTETVSVLDKELKVVLDNNDRGKFYLYFENKIIKIDKPNDPNAVINASVKFKDVVQSKWFSGITDLGINNAYKTMYQFTITLDPKYSGEVVFGYETRYSSGGQYIGTLGSFDFTNMDFTRFSFVGGFASSHTYRHKHRNFNYIMFMWESNQATDSAMLGFSVLYKIMAKSRGVK